MLTAGAAGAIGVDPQVFVFDVQVDLILNVRHDIQRYKGGLTLALGIKGGDTHQPVNAFLGL